MAKCIFNWTFIKQSTHMRIQQQIETYTDGECNARRIRWIWLDAQHHIHCLIFFNFVFFMITYNQHHRISTFYPTLRRKRTSTTMKFNWLKFRLQFLANGVCLTFTFSIPTELFHCLFFVNFRNFFTFASWILSNFTANRMQCRVGALCNLLSGFLFSTSVSVLGFQPTILRVLNLFRCIKSETEKRNENEKKKQHHYMHKSHQL